MLVQVLGEPGIGKSRLALELAAELESQATVLVGRCVSYGEGITFWPLVEALKQVFPEPTLEGIRALTKRAEHPQAIAERLAGLLGLTEAVHAREELFWAVRKFFELLARRRPLLLVFDDVHWAEGVFLDLLDHIAESRSAPILILCVARPELREDHAAFVAGRGIAATLALEALSAREAESLVETRGGVALAAQERARIVEAAEGNPLFLEQMVAFVRAGHTNGDALPVPPTIEALLAARLDRLGPGERTLLERAAVVGREFSLDAVAALLPDAAQPQAGTLLQSLIRKEFVRTDRPSHPLEETYRFRHVLIQEAAYRAVPKRIRAELHERVAHWLEQAAGALREDELVGYHFEQAYRLRGELGPIDDEGLELAARGCEYLGSAGRRAVARRDTSAAVSLLARATTLVPLSDDRCLELMPDFGRALVGAGELARAEAVLTEAVAAAETAGNRRVKWRAIVNLATVRYIGASSPGTDQAALRTAHAAISVFAELGDEQGLAQAWRTLAGVLQDLGRPGATRHAYERAHEHARRAGDRAEELVILNGIGHLLIWGPTPAEEAIRRWEEIRDDARGDPMLEAGCLDHLGVLYAMQGRIDEGRKLASRGRDMKLELGLKLKAASSSAFLCGYIETCAGDLVAAERELRFGYELLEGAGEKRMRGAIAALLARAICLQGRHDEAERFTQISEEIAMSTEPGSKMLWRAARAKILAAHGNIDQAESLAREAVQIARGMELPNHQGDVLMDLAEVLVLAGKQDEARAHMNEALQRFEEKGNLVLAGRVTAALATLAS